MEIILKLEINWSFLWKIKKKICGKGKIIKISKEKINKVKKKLKREKAVKDTENSDI